MIKMFLKSNKLKQRKSVKLLVTKRLKPKRKKIAKLLKQTVKVKPRKNVILKRQQPRNNY